MSDHREFNWVSPASPPMWQAGGKPYVVTVSDVLTTLAICYDDADFPGVGLASYMADWSWSYLQYGLDCYAKQQLVGPHEIP